MMGDEYEALPPTTAAVGKTTEPVPAAPRCMMAEQEPIKWKREGQGLHGAQVEWVEEHGRSIAVTCIKDGRTWKAVCSGGTGAGDAVRCYMHLRATKQPRILSEAKALAAALVPMVQRALKVLLEEQP